ncbi:hypothetical protein AB4Y42_43495 [Paraburkholderia sp. EG286B]|uniref:hypothetical protein n=1 Tax=Paraburkholderia sp. EG286B TaxID=3237011 RepID=UPI0034D1A99C
MLETKRQYGERVYDHLKDSVCPVLRSVSTRLTHAELATCDAQGFRRAAEESRLDVEVQRRHGQQKLERAKGRCARYSSSCCAAGPRSNSGGR